MTYSSGSPGYPPAQSPGLYGVATPSFAKDDGESKLALYLTIAVALLGLAAYLASFGPIFTISSELNPGGVELPHDAGYAIVVALLAALLAAVGLLPKAKNYSAIVAAIAVLGALLVIQQTLTKSSYLSIGWALWAILACTVAQAIAAVVALLLDSGVITPPAPRPKYDQYAAYGQYGSQVGGYYGQQTPYQQHAPQHSPQHAGYGSQYGGYPTGPSTGGFSAVGPQTGPQQSVQSGQQQGQQPGPPTPPTGFPSYSPPPSTGSATGPQGSRNSAGDQAGSGQGQHSAGQGQQSQSSSGQTQS
jgi:hypothetical protein